LIDELDIEKSVANELKTRLAEQIKAQRVKMKRTLEAYSYDPEGLDNIKSLFKVAFDFAKKKKIEMNIRYISAPKYEIEIVVDDYKFGETLFKEIFSKMRTYAEKHNVELKIE